MQERSRMARIQPRVQGTVRKTSKKENDQIRVPDLVDVGG